MRHLATWILACGLIGAGALPAQDVPAELSSVPAGCRNVFYLGDVLPMVQAVARDEAFVDALEGFDASMGSMFEQQVGVIEPFVPRSVVVAVSDDTSALFGGVIQALTAFQLMIGAGELEEWDQMDALRDDMLPMFDGLIEMDAFVSVQARSERMAESWFDSVDQFAQMMAIQSGFVTAEMRDDVLSIVVQPDNTAFAGMLGQLGIVDGPEDPFAVKLGQKFRRSPLRIAIALDGDKLVVRVGDAKGSMDPSQLRGLWGDRTPLVFAQWELTQLKASMRSAVEYWQNAKDTKLGKWLSDNDPEDFIGTVEDLDWQIDQTPAAAAMRGDVGQRSLDFEMVEDGASGFVTLGATGLLDWVPPTPLFLAGGDAFGDRLIGSMREFEDRLANQWMQASARDDAERMAVADMVTAGYYEGMKNTRGFLIDEGREWFGSGWVVLSDLRGRAQFGMPVGGDVEYTTPGPVPEFAIIARVSEGKTGIGYVRGLFSAIAKDVGLEAKAMTADLGLETETFGLPDALWSKIMPMRGDIGLHGFADGATFVLSTSPRLSRRILAARNGTQTRRPAGDLRQWVGSAEVRGEYFADMVSSAAQWMRKGGMDVKQMDALADVFQLIKSVESRSVLDGTRIRSEASFRF